MPYPIGKHRPAYRAPIDPTWARCNAPGVLRISATTDSYSRQNCAIASPSDSDDIRVGRWWSWDVPAARSARQAREGPASLSSEQR